MGLVLIYFIPHRYLPTLKLIELIKGAYASIERVAQDLQGRFILSLVPKAIVATFNPPKPHSSSISLTWEMRSSPNMRMNILSWINRNASTNFLELPSSWVLLSSFSSYL